MTSSNATPETFATGDTLTVSWTTTNTGAATADRTWYERVILTADEFIGNYDDILLANIAHSSPLAGYDSAPRSIEKLIPWGIAGDYQLIIRVDYWNYLPESDETNNAHEQDLTIDFAAPPADLEVETVVVDESGLTGQDATVSWRVANLGTATTPESLWYDRVWLSDDDAFGGDTLLCERRSESAAPGGRKVRRLVEV